MMRPQRWVMLLAVWALLLGMGLGLGMALGQRMGGPTPTSPVSPAHQGAPAASGVKVAFIGDQGLGEGARAVLRLIRDEGAHLVLHLGDFDYRDDPEAWDRQINEALGPDFPYLGVVGNHDVAAWPGYQRKLQERLARTPEVACRGDIGVKAVCTYRGVFFVLSGVGTMGSGHQAYIREQLAATDATWRICAWHKNMHLMQVGGKEDETGWGVYEECRRGGAIIATAHEHSYGRTHLMSSFQPPTIASTENVLRLEPGKTFVFHSGLGGESIREQERSDPWWASIYTRTQGADYGALFCTFQANGQPEQASCYFKDIRGREVDRFQVVSAVAAPVPAGQSALPAPARAATPVRPQSPSPSPEGFRPGAASGPVRLLGTVVALDGGRFRLRTGEGEHWDVSLGVRAGDFVEIEGLLGQDSLSILGLELEDEPEMEMETEGQMVELEGRVTSLTEDGLLTVETLGRRVFQARLGLQVGDHVQVDGSAAGGRLLAVEIEGGGR